MSKDRFDQLSVKVSAVPHDTRLHSPTFSLNGWRNVEGQSMGDGAFLVNTTPTSNCQVWSIAGFTNLLGNARDKEHFMDIMKVTWLKASSRKALLLVDINSSEHGRLIEWWPKNKFKVNEPYVSSNGSHMWLCLLDCRGIIFNPDMANVIIH